MEGEPIRPATALEGTSASRAITQQKEAATRKAMRTGDLTTTGRLWQCACTAQSTGWRQAPVQPAWSPSEGGATCTGLPCAPSRAPPEYADHAPCDLYVRATDWLEVFVLRL